MTESIEETAKQPVWLKVMMTLSSLVIVSLFEAYLSTEDGDSFWGEFGFWFCAQSFLVVLGSIPKAARSINNYFTKNITFEKEVTADQMNFGDNVEMNQDNVDQTKNSE